MLQVLDNKEKCKKWRENHPDYNRKWNEAHPGYHRDYYYKRDPVKLNKYRNDYVKRKKDNNVLS